MIPRFTAATLALAAFGIAVIAGVASGNPAELVLTRALWSLVMFCIIGFVIGWAAQTVISEFHAQRERELNLTDNPSSDGSDDEDKSTSPVPDPMGTQ